VFVITNEVNQKVRQDRAAIVCFNDNVQASAGILRTGTSCLRQSMDPIKPTRFRNGTSARSTKCQHHHQSICYCIATRTRRSRAAVWVLTKDACSRGFIRRIKQKTQYTLFSTLLVSSIAIVRERCAASSEEDRWRRCIRASPSIAGLTKRLLGTRIRRRVTRRRPGRLPRVDWLALEHTETNC
jgi:hypothetical protein